MTQHFPLQAYTNLTHTHTHAHTHTGVGGSQGFVPRADELR